MVPTQVMDDIKEVHDSKESYFIKTIKNKEKECSWDLKM